MKYLYLSSQSQKKKIVQEQGSSPSEKLELYLNSACHLAQGMVVLHLCLTCIMDLVLSASMHEKRMNDGRAVCAGCYSVLASTEINGFITKPESMY